MKIAYIGTPSFAAELLKRISLLPLCSLSYVITQPDKPVGRKQTVTPSAVKIMAESLRIPCYHSLDILQAIPVDLAILFAFGVIIPKWALECPKYGIWNVHPSLLPMYRGAAPTAFPLLLGDSTSGVTLLRMDEELDHGPVIASREFTLAADELRHDIERKIPDSAAELINNALSSLVESGSVPMQPQKHSRATFTRLLKKEDGYIPFPLLQSAWNGDRVSPVNTINLLQYWYEKNHITPPSELPASELIRNAYRALHGWPGLWTTIPVHGVERRVRILELDLHHAGLSITRVQLEGKQPVSFSTFASAYL